MDAGRKAYEKGQYDKALREYLKIVKEDPKDVRVWLKIGDLYTKKQANAEATETYMKVAAYYSDQGFFKKSVAVYKQILRVDPRLVEVNLKLAELYRQLGLLQDAMQHFEMVAAFFHREGKTQEALATLRQLVDLDPENVATRIKLAEVYSKEQMVPEAVREFTTTCDFLRKNGRQEDFLKVAERLLFHEPDNLDLCRELATLYLKRNDPRRALAKLQICFKADQSDPSVLALLAQAFQRLDQKGKTVSVLKELARVHAEAGRKGEATEVHEKILQYVPADPDSLTYLGRGARPSALADDVQFDAQAVAAVAAPPPSRHPLGRSTGSMPIVSPDDVGDYSEPVYEAPEEEGFLDSSLLDSDVSEEFPREDSFVADLELIEEEAAYDADSSVETQENADEIVKILTETDVYVKYGLNQKAVDHLRRIFELDERNIEARERLQSILIEEGRIDEGIAELLILAEHSLTRPDQALRYLLQIFEVDSNNAEAINFAARHRISIGQGSTSDYVNEDSFAGGTSEHLNSEVYESGEEGELDFDDLAFDEMPMGGDLPGQVTAAEPPRDHISTNGMDTRRGSRNFVGGSVPGTEPATVRVDPAEVERALAYGEFEDELDFALSSDNDLDFDRDAATAFDAGFSTSTSAQVPDFAAEEELEVDVISEVDVVELDSGELILGEDDTGVSSPPGEGDFSVPTPATPNSSNLEDDLDEADFFLSQGLFKEALEIIGPLLARYPSNPLVIAKHEDIAAGVASASGNTVQSMDVGSNEIAFAPEHLDDELLGDAIEDEFGPSVVLENPVDDNDADTHFDLGLAYKEMGLLSEAIIAFEKVLQVPSRAVQGRLMAGLCHRELGSLSEAISQFKAGLYESQISSAEKYSLYYEIGITYEGLQDPQEAMYYYEMVLKKDPEYRNIADRVAGIKGL